jgi:hypothetical protein
VVNQRKNIIFNSRIFKQMKIIHANGFKKEEQRLAYSNFIKRNIFDIFSVLIDGTRFVTKEEISKDYQNVIKIIDDEKNIISTSFTNLTPKVARELKLLWEDKAIQNAFARREELQLIDSAE